MKIIKCNFSLNYVILCLTLSRNDVKWSFKNVKIVVTTWNFLHTWFWGFRYHNIMLIFHVIMWKLSYLLFCRAVLTFLRVVGVSLGRMWEQQERGRGGRGKRSWLSSAPTPTPVDPPPLRLTLPWQPLRITLGEAPEPRQLPAPPLILMRFDTDGAHSWPLGRWVHSDNTCCMCLCPRDGLMRTYPKASQVREQVPGRSSCCRQACNHSLSPDSSRPQLSPMNTRRFSALPGSNFYRWFFFFL